jgi:PDZ domain-containing secreted protein
MAFSLFAQDQYTPQGYLGVESNHISRSKAEALGFDNRYGAYVTEVVENTAAQQNGIQPFDYLIGLNDKYFADGWSFSHAMHATKAGDQAIVNLIRNSEEISIPLTLGKQSEAIYRKVPKEEEPFLGVKQDHYNWKEKGPGVKVNIVNNSTAEAMGLQDEDIITAINGKRIIDWHDLGTAVDNMRPGDIINLNFIRDDQIKTVSAPINAYAATYTSLSHNKAKNYQDGSSAIEQEDSNDNSDSEGIGTNDSTVANSILADLEIDMEDVTQEEADDMKEKVGVDMPIINNLEIEQLNIFPNPTNGQFNITFDLPKNGQTTVRVFNGAGRLLYQNDMQQFKGRFQDRVDLSNSPKGIYFLEIRQDGKSLSKKIIVQ